MLKEKLRYAFYQKIPFHSTFTAVLGNYEIVYLWVIIRTWVALFIN